jgi:hypothetical protein
MVMRTLHPGWVYGTRRPLDFVSGSISISCPLLVLPAPTISGSLTEGYPNSFTAHAPETSRRSDLSPLECALPDKHRVLPVFSRNRRQSSPLAATLMDYVVSVDSKWFTENLSPLDATLTKNTGGEATFSSTFGRSDVRCSTFRQSHCSQTPLVPQSPKVPSFFTIRGNNSAPPGV